MLTAIIPKIPMRDRTLTYNYYVEKLGFKYIGSDDFEQYLIIEKDGLQIHFFEFKNLDPKENYGQIYIYGLATLTNSIKVSLKTMWKFTQTDIWRQNIGDKGNLRYLTLTITY